MAVYNNLDGTMKNELSIGKSNKIKLENASGKLNVKTNDTTRLSIDKITGALSIPGGNYFYVRGDVDTDGSVRYSSQLAGTMLHEKRENGIWTPLPLDGTLYPGVVTAPTITDNGNGTVNITGCSASLYSLPGWQGTLYEYAISAATNLSLTDSSVNYIIVDYNNGSPQYAITTNPVNINGSSKVLVSNMYRDGNSIHYITVNWGLSTASRLNDRLINTQRFERSSGLVLGETTGNVVTISSGVVWYGITAINEQTVTSASSNADLYYLSGGSTWNKSIVSAYDTTHYNNISTGLVEANNNRFLINWVYRYIDGSALPKIAIVLGTDEYTSAVWASSAPLPAIPTILSRQAILVGRIIVVKNAATSVQIDSAFTQVFSLVPSALEEHNILSGLQGGATDEYYHLTGNQHDTITYGPSAATDNALARFDTETGKLIQNSGVIVDDSNNIGISQSTFGTNATKTLAISTGAAPTTSPADAVQIYSKDFSAGNAVPTFRTEDGTEIQLNQNLSTTSSPSFSGLAVDTLSNFVKASNGVLSSSSTDPDMISSDINFATGIVSRTDNTISFNNSNTTFTIAPTGTDFSLYSAGIKFTKTTAQTLDLSTVSGWGTNVLMYVFFNSSGALSASTSVWGVNNGLSPIATVFWNGSVAIVGDERHGANRSAGGTWHKWAHLGFGTRYVSGLAGTFSSSSTTIASGAIEDEDIILSISPQTSMQMWYAAPGNTTMTTDGTLNTSALITAGALKYDNMGSITSVSTGYYVRNFIYATNNIDNPIACIVGQYQHSNINDARVSQFPSQPTYISAETRLLYTTVWQNVGGTPTYVESADYRTAPTSPNGALSIRPLFLDELEDVYAPTPSLDQVLRWNGSNWTNGSAATSSASPGIEFFSASPTILATGVNNANVVNSLSKTPVTTTQQTVATTISTTTSFVSAWLYNAALDRTSIDSGSWTFNTYAYINNVSNGRVTTISRGIYSVLPQDGASVTVTFTGAGTSRTVTASGGTPFSTTKITASATNTAASYLQTPFGLYQITARTSNTVVTVTVPSTYTNESAVAFSVWKRLFLSTSPTVTSVGAFVLYSWITTQPAFAVTTSHKLGDITFGTSNNTTTLTIAYDGTLNNTHFDSPLITLHNNLAGLQGGAANEYYHLTSAQATNYSNLAAGPASATDNAVARFDLTTGKLLQNSTVVIDDNNNTGIGQTTFGTNATKTLALSTGVAPTTSPTDAFQMYSKDFAAGNAVPTFRTEGGTEIQLNQSLTTTSAVTFGNLTAIYKGTTSQVGANSTLTATMTHVEQTASGITTTLWASPSTGDIINIKNNSSAANTIAGNGKLIETSSTWTLNSGGAVTLIYNGTLWLISNIGNTLIPTEQWVNAPASSTSSGIKGQFAYDDVYKYECVATNTWIRYAVERSF